MAQSQSLHRPPGPLWSPNLRRAGAHSAGQMDSPVGFSSPCAADAPVKWCSFLIKREKTEGDFALVCTHAAPHPS